MMKKNKLPAVADEIELDKNSGIVKRNGKIMRLTPLEFTLLEIFMARPNCIISKAELLQKVWTPEFYNGTNVLEVHIHHLRQKIDTGFDTTLLKTVVGVGYLLKMKTA